MERRKGKQLLVPFLRFCRIAGRKQAETRPHHTTLLSHLTPEKSLLAIYTLVRVGSIFRRQTWG